MPGVAGWVALCREVRGPEDMLATAEEQRDQLSGQQVGEKALVASEAGARVGVLMEAAVMVEVASEEVVLVGAVVAGAQAEVGAQVLVPRVG